MNLTAVINNFKRPEYYARCIASLREHYPDISVISVSDENLSRARNDGMRQVVTDHVLFCDDDMEFTKDTNLAALLTLMEIADIAGGEVGGLMYEGVFKFSPAQREVRYSPIDHTYAEYKGIRFQQCDFIPNFFVGKVDKLRDIEWCEEIRIAWEHIDFFLEAWGKGLTTVFSPDAKILHRKNLAETEEYRICREDDAESKKAFFNRWRYKRVISMDGDILTP